MLNGANVLMKKIIILSVMFCSVIFGDIVGMVNPVGTTMFQVSQKNGTKKTISLRGEEFIVISVRERGSDGRFYAVDRDGVVWWSGAITSGADDYKTPSGIYSIKYKRRYYMSKKYPDENGINNMDYSMFFTNQGHALHKGNTGWMSHGCIHIDPKDIKTIYNWAHNGTIVVVTKASYMPFARKYLKAFNVR